MRCMYVCQCQDTCLSLCLFRQFYTRQGITKLRHTASQQLFWGSKRTFRAEQIQLKIRLIAYKIALMLVIFVPVSVYLCVFSIKSCYHLSIQCSDFGECTKKQSYVKILQRMEDNVLIIQAIKHFKNHLSVGIVGSETRNWRKYLS